MMDKGSHVKLMEKMKTCGKITVLDFMCDNPEYLDRPGYEMSQIFLKLAREGYLTRTEDDVKAYYEITPKAEEEAVRIRQDARKVQEYITDKNNAEAERVRKLREEAEQKRKNEWRTKGLCQYCGGALKGLFTKKCQKCGKPKDY